MALYVKIPSSANERQSERDWYQWHLGEIFPFDSLPRVVEIQADGDELQILLAALRSYSRNKPIREPFSD